MRVCDKCENKTIATVLIDAKTDEEICLCVECASAFNTWRHGRPTPTFAESVDQVPVDPPRFTPEKKDPEPEEKKKRKWL